MELTRFLERHTTIGGVGCRGQELSRILSLPMGERPEAACEGTLKRGRLPVKEMHRLKIPATEGHLVDQKSRFPKA